ncbi:MAG: divergent PAP2 family protein [Desulfobacterales bacterium]|nr:divergent PAP2 family protein [Desulfobacterales bacterium]MCP4161075.1 divergent PAP2 family protein [Deltaproteobacteria bacterium]
MDLKLIFQNQILICAAASWVFAQSLKIFIILFKRHNYETKDLIIHAVFGTGGMPSSHTATVTAITLSIGFKEGFNTGLFALSVIFLLIVFRDATGVRLASGQQAITINRILDEIKIEDQDKVKKIKEVKGHTLLEGLVGSFIGIIVSLAFCFAI